MLAVTPYHELPFGPLFSAEEGAPADGSGSDDDDEEASAEEDDSEGDDDDDSDDDDDDDGGDGPGTAALLGNPDEGSDDEDGEPLPCPALRARLMLACVGCERMPVLRLPNWVGSGASCRCRRRPA